METQIFGEIVGIVVTFYRRWYSGLGGANVESQYFLRR